MITPAPVWWVSVTGAPQPSLGSIPQHQLCCPKVDWFQTLLGWLQENALAVSYLITRGNQSPLQGIFESLAFLLPVSLTPSAAEHFWSPCQVIPWSQITTAEQLQFDFPLCFCKILIEKLIKFGVYEQTVGWTENWLNRWAQRIVISGTKSSWGSVASGVSWGVNTRSSHISSNLQMMQIYINDVEGGTGSSLSKVADDM